jgi:hypothetical protein
MRCAKTCLPDVANVGTGQRELGRWARRTLERIIAKHAIRDGGVGLSDRGTNCHDVCMKDGVAHEQVRGVAQVDIEFYVYDKPRI